METVLRKIIGNLHETAKSPIRSAISLRSFAPEQTDAENFRGVLDAITRCRVIHFDYRKPGTPNALPRALRPYHTRHIDGRWYVFGHDLDRQEIRTFAISRMLNLKITNISFPEPTGFDPEQFLSTGLAVMTGRGDFKVVIELDPWATDQVRDRPIHSTQTLHFLPSGASHATLRLSCLKEIQHWILSYAPHAVAVSPQALVDSLAELGTTIHQLHSPQTTQPTRVS